MLFLPCTRHILGLQWFSHSGSYRSKQKSRGGVYYHRKYGIKTTTIPCIKSQSQCMTVGNSRQYKLVFDEMSQVPHGIELIGSSSSSSSSPPKPPLVPIRRHELALQLPPTWCHQASPVHVCEVPPTHSDYDRIGKMLSGRGQFSAGEVSLRRVERIQKARC